MSATVNTVVKKTFPVKYIKYLSYGLKIIKEIYPEDYKQKAFDYLHLYESVPDVMNDIDASLTSELEEEVKEIKREFYSKARNKRAKSAKKEVIEVAKEPEVVAESITEKLVELANEPTIVRDPDAKESEVVAKSTKKRVTKPKAKKVTEEVTEVATEVATEVTEVATEVTEVATVAITPEFIAAELAKVFDPSDSEEETTKVAKVTKKRVTKPKAKKVTEVTEVAEVAKESEVVVEVAEVVVEVAKESEVVVEVAKESEVVVEVAEVVVEVAKVPKKRVTKPKAKKVTEEITEVTEVTNELEAEPEVAKSSDIAPWSLKAKNTEEAQLIKKCFGINVPPENIGRE